MDDQLCRLKWELYTKDVVRRHVRYHSVMTVSLASCVQHLEDCRYLQSSNLKTPRTENYSPGNGKVMPRRDGLLRPLVTVRSSCAVQDGDGTERCKEVGFGKCQARTCTLFRSQSELGHC